MEKKSKNQREEVQKKNLYLYVYGQIKEGLSPQQISNKYNLKKTKVDYYTSRLKQLNLIKKISYGVWEVVQDVSNKDLLEMLKQKKSKLFSIGTRGKPKSDLHALQIKFPILSGKINDSDWQVKEKLKNWTPKYTKLKDLGGLRLKNNNNKSLTVWAEAREVQNVSEVHDLAHKIRFYIEFYFRTKHNVRIDHLNCETKNLDYATEDKHAESMRGKGEKFKLDLNKTAERIFPKDNIKAEAWIDGSPFKFSTETNDLEWKREYLNMPFSIRSLLYSMPALAEYNKNLKLHISVQQEQLKNQKIMNKLLQELKSEVGNK